MMASEGADSLEEERNWAEMPPDVLALVFQKVGTLDMIFRAQSVCTSWRKVTFEPLLWRSVDLRFPWDDWNYEHDLENWAKQIVDRSKGQLVEISIEEFGSDSLLQYLADGFSNLKCLRLNSCYQVTEDGFLEAIVKLRQLEELDISHCSLSSGSLLEVVGCTCKQLKSLQINTHGFRHPHIECDEEALAIGKTMPELRHLEICGNKLTDNGLRAILDGCPHIEYLNMSQCFGLTLERSLQKRCLEKIKNLKLPEMSDDYDDDDEYGFIGSVSFDEDYPSGFTDIDGLSDGGYYEFSDGSDWSYPFGF